MLAIPIIIIATYVPASHWNYIEWAPLDPASVITIKRSPAFSGGNPIAQDKTWFVDQHADPKLGYTYTVCASLGGDSSCSEPVSLPPSPVSEPSRPAAPRIVSATPTLNSIEIVWQASQNFRPYQIIWGRDNSTEQPQVEIDSGGLNGSWRTPSNLQPGTLYHFRIQGCVGGLIGCSDWSPNYHIRTSQAPPPPPAVPTITATLVNTGLDVRLTFTGVPGATTAKIFRYRKGNSNAEAEYDSNSNSASFTDPDLAPFVTYGYRVASLGKGISAISDIVYVTTFYNPVVSHPNVFATLPFTPLSTASWGVDRMDVVYADPSHDIKRQAWDVGTWLPGPSDWQSLGNWTSGTPVVAATPPLGSTVFVLGQDFNVYAKNAAGGYAPQDWEPLGGKAVTTPAAISATPGRTDVFIVGTDHQIYQKTRSNGSWLPSQTDWSPLGGYSVDPPVAVSSGPGRIDLFISGADQAVYRKTWDGNQWLPSVGGWYRVGGTIIGAPSAVSWGPGRIDLFVVGTDFNIYRKTWDNGRWYPSDTGWEAMGGPAMGPPALATWGPGRLDVFIVGTDKGIYHKAWNGTKWLPSQSGWEAVGGTVYGDRLSVGMPSVVSWGPGRLDLFVMGTDKAVYAKSLLWNQWVPANGWVAHGGQVQVGN